MSGQPPYLSAAAYPYPRDVRYGPSSTVDSPIPLSRRPQMLTSYNNQYTGAERSSILPYYLPTQAVSMGGHVDENSKRAHHPAMHAQFLPLGIDVKKEQALYQPATEAISPINDETKFDTHLRDTTIIKNAICKLDSEIEMTRKKLQRAKLSQNEIQRQADRTAVDDEEEEIENPIRLDGSQTLIEKILHENRKRAEDGQKILNQLNHQMDLTIPLYHQPTDLQLIGEIRKKYMNIMKNRLINYFKRSREQYLLRMKASSEKYDENYRHWQKSIEKEEKTILANDASTYRDTFEKTFPELRKAREDKEKKQSNPNNPENASNNGDSQQSTSLATTTTTTTTTTTSNAVEHEIGEDDEKMRRSSVVPPVLYDSWQRKRQYFNQNGLIKGDVALFYKEHAKMPYWSAEERQIFVEKFTQSPKNFGFISLFLENKTTEQCVQFYYMTKKTENYKSLLRKHSQASRRRAKPIATTNAIDTTLVTKVTSFQMINSNNGNGQDNERSADRGDNDEDRREFGENNEDKRINKGRCQLLSCTMGRRKPRRIRLRGFPHQWNELNDEHREEIRRSLKIPSNVQRCCKCCYEKLFQEIRQRQDNQGEEDEEEVDEEEENNEGSSLSNRTTLKRDDDEWTAADTDAFTQAVEKFNYNWREIAQYLQRSEESCRAFYQNQPKAIAVDHNLDDDNRSLSDSETPANKSLHVDESVKANVNEDSNDSPRPMIIDEVEETRSMNEDNPAKPTTRLPSNPAGSNLTTINSLIEQEISRTLGHKDTRLNPSSVERPEATSHPSVPPATAAITTAPAPPPPLAAKIPTPQPAPAPPLVIPVRTHSPSASHYPYSSYPPVPTTSAAKTGSIMRGTPISASPGMNKNVPMDPTAANHHPHPYHSSRNETNPMKSPKILDRHLEHQFLMQQQQQQQQQQHHHNPYARQYEPSPQAPSTHKSSSSSKFDPSSNPNTYDTLKTDFLTSRFLTSNPSSHSASLERPHRSAPVPSSEHRMSRQAPSPLNQGLLPRPAAIVSSTSTSSVPPSTAHPHHVQQANSFLPTPQMLAAPSGMYPPEFVAGGLLPYGPYHGSLPSGAQFLIDPRVMRDYALAVANSEPWKIEQQKLPMRRGQHHHPSNRSPPDPSPTYPPHPNKRNIREEMAYPNADYGSSVWRTPASSHAGFSRGNHGTNENPLAKVNEYPPRQGSSRMPSGNERASRSPDEHLHPSHRMNPSRSAVESPSGHFQRVDMQNHQRMPPDTSNPHLSYLDHPNDGNSLGYSRQPMHIPKPQPTHASSHRSLPNTNSSGRSIIPSSPHPPHPSNYMMHGFPPGPMGTMSPQRQQSSSHQHPTHGHSHAPPSSSSSQHYPSSYRVQAPHTSESITEYIKNRVNEFVRSTNHDSKHSTSDPSSYEPSTNPMGTRHPPVSNPDQPIFIDGNDDASPPEHTESDANMRTHQSHLEGDMPARRRDSSIKKILSNQSLEKQEYDEINQRVQSNPNNSSRGASNNDPSGLERSNSIGGRTRSRGSITMRMLMGDNEPYVDGKAQRCPSKDEPSNKRPFSPNAHHEKIGYLIRDELSRSYTSVPKDSDAPSVFQKGSSASQQPTAAKRMRTSTREDDLRQSSNRSPIDSNATLRDPFALQPHSKSAHQSPFAPASSADRSWHTHAQQQFHHSSSSPNFASRSSSRSGSSMPPGMRIPTEQGPYAPAANNQLINPRYPYYVNKNEQQYSLSRQSSTSPHDQSAMAKMSRRPYHRASSPSDPQPISAAHFEHSPNAKSPSVNPMMMTNSITGNTPPTTASPTANSSHSLKKRLITEFSLEQQRNSPVTAPSPTPSASTRSDGVEENHETHSKNDSETVAPRTDIPLTETVHESTDDPGHST